MDYLPSFWVVFGITLVFAEVFVPGIVISFLPASAAPVQREEAPVLL